MKYDNRIATSTFDAGEGFRVDVVVDNTKPIAEYSAWIYHKDCGIKEFLWGAEATQQTYAYFCALTEGMIEDDKTAYRKEYMDC